MILKPLLRCVKVSCLRGMVGNLIALHVISCCRSKLRPWSPIASVIGRVKNSRFGIYL